MDFRLIEAVFRSALPPAQRLVLLAMANCKWDAESICNPSIATLESLTRLSRRQILRAIAALKQRGIIAVPNVREKGRKGATNTYVVTMEKLSTNPAKVGDTMTPTPAKVGDTMTPTPAKVGDTMSPTPAKVGDTMSPKNNSRVNNKCVCHNAPARGRVREGAAAQAAAHTHTFNFSDDDLSRLAAASGVPLAFVKERVAEWARSDWTTTQGKPIKPESLKAHLVAWWKHEKNPERYERPQRRTATPRKFTAKDWVLCAERCAHCTGSGCGKGITTPPDKGAHQYPPEDCTEFAAIAAER